MLGTSLRAGLSRVASRPTGRESSNNRSIPGAKKNYEVKRVKNEKLMRQVVKNRNQKAPHYSEKLSILKYFYF